MRTKLFSQAPPALTVLAVLVFLCVLLNREASIKEDLNRYISIKIEQAKKQDKKWYGVVV
jgi:hypothetical protein